MKKNSKNENSGTEQRGSEGLRTVGIDLGDRYSHFAVLEQTGTEFVEEGQIPTTPDAFRKKFGHWKPARIALEAGTHARWVASLLRQLGHEVIVANPRELRGLTHSTRKHDREDARKLARYARADVGLLKPVVLRSEEAQRELLKLQTRETLVRTRVQLITAMRGFVKGFGMRLPKCTTQGFVRRAAASLNPELQPILQPLMEVIELTTELIKEADEQLETMVREDAVASQLKGVPGVGPVTAMAYVLTIEDPGRFARSREVGSHLGLTPRSKQSGQSDPQLGISKAGNEMLRRLLVQCSHRLLGPQGQDCALRRWGLKLAGVGNQRLKKRAVVAVARKLAVLLHRLWISGESFVAFPGRAEMAAA